MWFWLHVLLIETGVFPAYSPQPVSLLLHFKPVNEVEYMYRVDWGEHEQDPTMVGNSSQNSFFNLICQICEGFLGMIILYIVYMQLHV